MTPAEIAKLPTPRTDALLTRLRSLAAKAKYRHSEADAALTNAAEYIEQLERQRDAARRELAAVTKEQDALLSRPSPQEVLEAALKRISDNPPYLENSIHGPRMRCLHCLHAWCVEDGKSESEHHDSQCAWVIATSALASNYAAPQESAQAAIPRSGVPESTHERSQNDTSGTPAGAAPLNAAPEGGKGKL